MQKKGIDPRSHMTTLLAVYLIPGSKANRLSEPLRHGVTLKGLKPGAGDEMVIGAGDGVDIGGDESDNGVTGGEDIRVNFITDSDFDRDREDIARSLGNNVLPPYDDDFAMNSEIFSDKIEEMETDSLGRLVLPTRERTPSPQSRPPTPPLSSPERDPLSLERSRSPSLSLSASQSPPSRPSQSRSSPSRPSSPSRSSESSSAPSSPHSLLRQIHDTDRATRGRGKAGKFNILGNALVEKSSDLK